MSMFDEQQRLLEQAARIAKRLITQEDRIYWAAYTAGCSGIISLDDREERFVEAGEWQQKIDDLSCSTLPDEFKEFVNELVNDVQATWLLLYKEDS